MIRDHPRVNPYRPGKRCFGTAPFAASLAPPALQAAPSRPWPLHRRGAPWPCSFRQRANRDRRNNSLIPSAWLLLYDSATVSGEKNVPSVKSILILIFI